MDATAGRGPAPDLRLIRTVDDVLGAAVDRQACVHRHPAGMTQREAEVADDLRGFDPVCRYARNSTMYPTHECRRNTGQPIYVGETCFAEAHAQLHELSAEWACTSCGERIPVVGGRGSVTTPDGTTYRFHAGICFLRADDAIAALQDQRAAGGAR